MTSFTFWVLLSWALGFPFDYSMFERLVLVGLAYLFVAVTFWGFTNAKKIEGLEDRIEEFEERDMK
jgi:hypothetical protein